MSDANYHNIMDPQFNGMPEMYRAEVFPELFPHAPRMRLENWSQDDLEMTVGGVFTPGYGMRHVPQRVLMGAERTE
ncbi:hypothetical protein SEA_DARTHPHADER_49 [Mycobacterium phage DarthPhader]|uniref:Uncharacterized protein n=1 Tax=Mycobacterium phage DarthPhader TaxID=1912975 RepID=A0A1I9S3Z5_9CAUD|nr:hypothetical protein KIV60_gp52 [Mycobacterium phage DarthPhader]AOZ61289.1 hypothetical protein SEA_DARTHPHADER_49 [Mycobacterium phage DarthPhader]